MNQIIDHLFQKHRLGQMQHLNLLVGMLMGTLRDFTCLPDFPESLKTLNTSMVLLVSCSAIQLSACNSKIETAFCTFGITDQNLPLSVSLPTACECSIRTQQIRACSGQVEAGTADPVLSLLSTDTSLIRPQPAALNTVTKRVGQMD